MAEQTKLPSETEFNAFAGRLREFRGTLPGDQQQMLDAMVHAAFKTEDKGDVQGYWWAVRPSPVGPVTVAGPGPIPGWYGAPVYIGTPWAYSYGYGYPPPY
jgi:hypothetical protein